MQETKPVEKPEMPEMPGKPVKPAKPSKPETSKRGVYVPWPEKVLLYIHITLNLLTGT